METMETVKTVKKLEGFWTGGPYSLICSDEEDDPLAELEDVRIPAREEIHPLASFVIITPPSGLSLEARGEIFDDDDFYLAVLLKDRPTTFGEALEKGRVYAFFPGEEP